MISTRSFKNYYLQLQPRTQFFHLLLFSIVIMTMIMLSMQQPPTKALYDEKSFKQILADFGNSILRNKTYAQMPPELPQLSGQSPKLRHFLSKPVINPHNFGYVSNPSELCTARKVDILFVVPSAPRNAFNRHTVRQSVEQIQDKLNAHHYRVGVAFFVGLPDDAKGVLGETQGKVTVESLMYRDVVQENFTDIYSNIRLKAASMLRWASTYCQKARYVIRTDDDVTVNVKKIINVMERANKKHDNFIMGDVKVGEKPKRDVSNKYHLPTTEFSESEFPPFALGGLLGYPLRTVRLLYEAMLRVKPIWLDDVYVTGICAPEVNTVLLSDPDFTFMHGEGMGKGYV